MGARNGAAELDAEDRVRRIAWAVELFGYAKDVPKPRCECPSETGPGWEGICKPEVSFNLDAGNHV